MVQTSDSFIVYFGHEIKLYDSKVTLLDSLLELISL